MITMADNLARLNVALAEYLKHTKQGVDEAMAKQGAKLAFEISKRLATEKPGKGSIRAERMAALRSGEGIRIRESLRDREMKRNKRSRLNAQALRVKKEIALRERGRGFLAQATRINAGKLRGSSRVEKRGRYQQKLAEAGLMFSQDGAGLQIIYGGPQSEFGGVLNRPRYQRHISAALADVADDIMIYVDRKQSEVGNA